MKHMKKSMFISTVMMVVLLVVALSTATFAWFSANDTVTATQTTMTAATSTDANIQISWAQASGYGQTISFKTASNLQPSMPKMLPTDRTTSVPAQYITTAETYSSGVNFEYAGAPAVPYVNVLNVNLSNTVALTDATSANYAGLVGEPALLGRIYRTQYARDSFYLMTQATVASGFTAFPEGNYLSIVADEVDPIDFQIRVSDVAYTLYSSGANFDNNITATPTVGFRIYNIDAVADIHRFVALNAPAPSGWLAGGIDGTITSPGDVDYDVVVSTAGSLDTLVGGQYYINQPAVNGLFGVSPSRAGDRIYCVRAASSIDKTTYADFTTTNFFTSTINETGRFRDTIAGATPITLSELDGDRTSFWIKNNNAEGSPAAKVNLYVDFEGDAAVEDIRLAVFVRNTTDAFPYYVGTLATAARNTYYGTIAFGAVSTAPNFGSYAANGNQLLNFVQVDPQQAAQIYVVAWYDGIGLDSVKSGQEANFSFRFTAE